MFFVNDRYEITVGKAYDYNTNSADNKHYDKCIEADEKCDTYYEVEVLSFEKGEVFSIVLAASYCTKISEHSGILKDDVFYLILDHRIVKLDLEEFSCDVFCISKPLGTYYEIYDWHTGFLVYGDLELVWLDRAFHEQWRYCTQDILYGVESLQLSEETICFTDFEGNYHEVDCSGKQCKYEKYTPKIVTIHMENVKTPLELQHKLKQILGMPDFYGENWDAYWDAITGLISLPDELILDGWHKYKSIQREDAEKFERIMKEYNALEDYKHCECIYMKYI